MQFNNSYRERTRCIKNVDDSKSMSISRKEDKETLDQIRKNYEDEKVNVDKKEISEVI
jgi:hypothetical protein